MNNVVLVEDNLHELDGKYGWDPMWRGSHAIYGRDSNHCYSFF